MTQEQVNALTLALQNHFAAEVEAEAVNGQGRYRFAVVAPRFANLTQLERQDEVWAVVDRTLPREATLDVSLILTFAPADLATPT